MDVYLEIGHSRVFAIAAGWPGWCRGGRSEATALQALRSYAPRYARVMRAGRLSFPASALTADFNVLGRVAGTATTDMGAPDVALPGDDRPVGEAELRRFQRSLRACWRALDAAAEAAAGQALSKGPRGGGRDLAEIVAHARGADELYLGRLGGKPPANPPADPAAAMALTRQTILDTLVLSAQGQLPARGPRGGLRWGPRYLVRRMAWHDLDHAWEIEDRAAA